jgi:glycosyltransferase involved in cell wall biosynthesis
MPPVGRTAVSNYAIHRYGTQESLTSTLVCMTPAISIIVPTYNRLALLRQCIQSLKKIKYAGLIELVIVNDGSTDGTKDFLNALQLPTNFTFIPVHQKNKGCAAARNVGVRTSTHDYIFFTDDDCVVPYNWVSEIINAFTRYPDAQGVGGWYQSPPEILNSNVYMRTLHNEYKLSFGEYLTFEHASARLRACNPAGNTANVCYRRSLFQAIGGFSEWTKSTARIDWEFKFRAHAKGYELVYIPYRVLHTRGATFFQFIKQAWRYGVADYYLGTRFEGSPLNLTISRTLMRISMYRVTFPHENILPFLYLTFLRLIGAWWAHIRGVRSDTRYSQVSAPNVQAFTRSYTDGRKTEMVQHSQQYYQNSTAWITARAQSAELLAQEHKTPLISIVMPMYNRTEYLTNGWMQRINELEAHATAVELVCVDDGSTDETVARLEELRPLLRFELRIMQRVNGGPAAARNTGIEHARGTYICFTDTDTLPYMLWLRELLAPVFIDPRTQIVGGYQMIQKPITAYDAWRSWYTIKHREALFINELSLFVDTPCDTANMMMVRSCPMRFNETFKRPGFEDLEFVYRAKKKGYLLCYIPYAVENMRSMNKEDYYHLIHARAHGYSIFMDLHDDPAFKYSWYYVGGCLLGKGSMIQKDLTIGAILVRYRRMLQKEVLKNSIADKKQPQQA